MIFITFEGKRWNLGSAIKYRHSHHATITSLYTKMIPLRLERGKGIVESRAAFSPPRESVDRGAHTIGMWGEGGEEGRGTAIDCLWLLGNGDREVRLEGGRVGELRTKGKYSRTRGRRGSRWDRKPTWRNCWARRGGGRGRRRRTWGKHSKDTSRKRARDAAKRDQKTWP